MPSPDVTSQQPARRKQSECETEKISLTILPTTYTVTYNEHSSHSESAKVIYFGGQWKGDKGLDNSI